MKRTGYTKLLAHHHTGKIRHHKHTSYGSLALVLLLTFVPVLVASRSVASAATDGSGGYETYAVVLGPAPTTAPTILGLVNGQSVDNNEQKISGNCPAGTLVKVFKNEILAGAALCQAERYQMTISLFVGANTLTARAYNSNDTPSPDSALVNVQLVLPTSLNKLGRPQNQAASEQQFYITSEQYHRGADVGETMTWPLTIVGGVAPYAVNVSWGDGKSDLISRSEPGQFNVSHVYSKPGGYRGSYKLVAKATDSAGQESLIQLAAIVSGDGQSASIVTGVTGGYSKSAVIRTAWQMLAASVVITLVFWLGEQRAVKMMHRPRYGI